MVAICCAQARVKVYDATTNFISLSDSGSPITSGVIECKQCGAVVRHLSGKNKVTGDTQFMTGRSISSQTWLALGLVLLFLGFSMPGWRVGAASGNGGKLPALAGALNSDGSLRAGVDGSFDTSGYRMEMSASGAPRFMATACSGYDTQFALPNGTNGSVYATVVKGTDIYIGGSFTAVGGINANCIARFDTVTGIWNVLGTASANGVDNTVTNMVFVGNDLYVAGSFQRANIGGTTINASQIAKFNIQTNTWSAVSGGPVFVHAMVANGTDLYLGGGFTVVNSNLAANYIAKLDTLTGTWSTLGTGGGNGLNTSVNAMVLIGSELYVGGLFTSANVGGSIVSASRMAKFNLTTNTWSALSGASGGNGVSAPVNTLLVKDNDLYVGGSFVTANVGGTNLIVNNLAKYNIQTSTWSALGTGGGSGVDNTVNTLTLNGNDLYVGGAFTKANINGTTVNVSKLARYNIQTSVWSALGTGGANGVDNTVRSLALVDNELYTGGDFTAANVGGTIVNASYIGRFNTTSSSWSVLGPGSGNGLNGQINALAVSGTDIYMGGDFTLAGNTSANRLAKFNTVTNTWSALSGASGGNGVNGTVNALLLKDNDLYVGGTFTTANVGGTTVSVNRLAKFNTTTGAWSALGTGAGNGVDNTVRTLALIDNDLYVGGDFLNANTGANVAANRIARVNITSGTWSKIGTGSGNGVDNNVRALVVSGNDLYIGGNFLNANIGTSISANRVAKFNTTTNTWSVLGTGSGNGVGNFSANTVYALAVSGNFLYVGGYFDTVNVGGTNLNANNIAKVNTTTGVWSPLTISFSGGGVIGANDSIAPDVYALFLSGNDLYVGGKFSFSEYPTSISTNRVARVDIRSGQWGALPDTDGSNGIVAGIPFRNYVNAIAKLGSDLYLGGSFAAVGDNRKPSANLAHICNRAPTITQGSQLTAVQNTTTSNNYLGSVSDDLSTNSGLQISVTAPTGITFSNFTVNNVGNVLADMTVSCAAATGQQTITVQVSDGSLTASANMTVSVIKNEINVNGSTGVAIPDGSTTPTAANGADFGATQITGGTVTRTFTIQNTSSGALTVSGITLSGANASDFTISGITFPKTINFASSTSFTVTFDPSATSTRTATINIVNDDCDEGVYDFAIQGLGSGAEYTVTTSGGAIVVNDLAGNADTLAITEPSSGTIKFAAAGRVFLVNNSTLITGDTGTLTLSGINSITLNQGIGDDTVNVGAFTSILTVPSLTINGDAGNDTVNFNGSITFAANANLDVNLQNDTATPGVDTINVTAQLITSNAGAIDMRASRSVTVGSGGRLQIQNGNLTVQANQQTTPTSGAFTGVLINGGLIQGIGSGAISISGRGGNSGDNQIGVAVQAGGSVLAFGATSITIAGTGGAGANGNAGVSVNGLNTTGTAISAVNGNINITGTAATTVGTDQDGVRFANSTGAQTTAVTITGSGQLTITGTAGNSDATSAGINLIDDTTMTPGSAAATFIADTMDIGTSNVSVTSTNAVTLKVKLATQGIDLGGADSITALGLTDSELDRITCATLNLGDTTNTSLINVNAAITRSASTNLNLLSAPPPATAISINSGGSLDSAGGNVTFTSQGTGGLKPAATGVDVNMSTTGTLAFQTGSTFNVAINGTTVDTGYQQLNVAGKLNLTNCTLAFNGTTPIATQTTFIIINNDGTDAITGTFNGLPEGAIINNFLGTGKTASISYVGGTGNDVTITSPSSAPIITAAAPLVRQQGAAAINSVIATVSDPNQGAGSVTVTALNVPTGISITNIVNANGTVTADVSASCLAATSNHTIVLQASNGTFLNQAFLTVTVNGSEINIKGNNVSIPDGSTTPGTGNGTDFGTTSAPLPHTFTIENSGNQSLTVSGISISGTNASDFTVGNITFPTTINMGSSKTFTITFVPGGEGTRTATVNIANNDCDENLYDFRVQGAGAGPDYEITTTGGNIVVTDLTGHDDYLVVYEPEPDHIAFIGYGLVLRVNGTPVAEDSGSLSLAGINSITVNAGNGFDTVDVGSFTSALPSLTINGDADDDTTYFSGSITFAADANLDVNLQNDSATSGFDYVYVVDAVAATGTGTIDLRTNFIIEVYGSLQTENGSLTVEANQQSTSASGNYSGVTVYGAIRSVGSGDVTVKGRGLDSGDDNPGIAIYGLIQGGDSGTVRVTGNGGQDPTGMRNRGILIDGGQIASSGANLEVTGTGTDNATGFNAGIRLASGGQIVAGGAGTVKVTGNGGAAASTNFGFSDGVLLENTSTKIASENGDVTVTGNSSAPVNNNFSYGIRVGFQGSGTDVTGISAGGTGVLTLLGTATGTGNAGVNVDSKGSLSASGGALQVTGISRSGVTVHPNAMISNPTGSVTVISDRLDFQGTINATTLTLRQKTDGTDIYLGANTLSPGLSLWEIYLDGYTCNTLNIGDSHSGIITVSQPITRPALTHVNLTAGGDINFNFGLNTAGGNVTVTPGTGHKVTAAATSADAGMGATGTLSFVNTPTLSLVINGTSAGQYDQLSVTGSVNLTGVGLAFQGTPSISGTPNFTIVNNDGTDPITGTFTGLPEGATISNFLNSGRNATISYVGGDGNDAVVTVLPPNTAPSINAANGLSRQQGSAASNSTIATVGDTESGAGGVTVTVNDGASATVNGVTVAGIVNTNGTITANIVADCTATNASFTLTASDGSLITNATLNVTVVANTATVLGNYSTANVTIGQSTTVMPSAAPIDNGTISSMTALAPNFTGTFSVDKTTGVVTVSNAGPVGSYTVAVTATDNCNAQSTKTFTLNVNCQTITVTAPVINTGTAGAAFNQTFTQAGGIGTTTFSTTSPLPNGITLSSAGVLSGTTVQTGSFPITVKATDTNGCFGTVSYTLTINCPTITLSPNTLIAGTIGSSYSQNVAASPAGTYSYAVTSGALPGGLNLNSANGAITGTPTATSNFNFTITATLTGAATPTAARKQSTQINVMAPAQCSGSQAYTLTINCQTITVTAPVTNTGIAGTIFSQTFTQSGGIGTTTFSTTSPLPTGINLSNAGVLSGTPSQTGTFPITVKATDANGCFGTVSYTLIINCPSITLNPASPLPDGTTGIPYTSNINVTGGTAPYTFTVTTGSVPTGLTLNSNGTWSGAPTTAQTYNFTVKATDGNLCTGTQAYSITVHLPDPTLATYPDTNVNLGGNVTITPAAAPTTTAHINVSTATAFNGTFVADPATGKVYLTNAHPAGTYMVTVTAFNGEGVMVSKSFTLTVTTPVTCNPVFFNAPLNLSAPAGVNSVAIGDFNRDGKQDLATISQGTNKLAIRLGNGDGSFNASTSFDTANNPSAIATGDLNSDGKADLVTVQAGVTANVSIFAGNGNGTFGAATNLTAGDSPAAVAIGDISGDGKPDLVVANSNSNNVSVFAGNGNGTFNAAMTFNTGGNAARGVAIGDFNGDNQADIAVTNRDSNNVTVLLGDGHGNFTAATNSPFAVNALRPASLAIGDFNGDGKQDLATANNGSDNVSVLIGNGSGGLGNATTFNTGKSPTRVVVGDFNGDGRQDLAASNADATSNNVSLLSGDGNGSFAAATNYSVGSNPAALAAGDFNSDGKQDLVTANTGSADVTVLIRKCNTAPTITAATGISRPRGGALANSQIATVGDTESGAGNVSVTITSANPANGVTLSNITNTSGTIRADIVASCNASNATFTLQASDGYLTATTSLTVTVTPDVQLPTLSCPANITSSTAPGSCSKVVNYAVPVASDNCEGATVICAPPSGSIFNKGTTTVTCTATDATGNKANCSFTVTIIDTQAPSITCPANLTRVTAKPGDSTVAVNFAIPTATDNCGSTTVTCTPVSGAVFPTGTTTVTCTATDQAGNQNSCSFTVTVYDSCLQDDNDANTSLIFNTRTGDYIFCCGGMKYSGTGTVMVRGNIYTLQHNTTDRRVTATMDGDAFRGVASYQRLGSGAITCSLNDRNIRNNTCPCQTQ
jgi:hypothetical protein